MDAPQSPGEHRLGLIRSAAAPMNPESQALLVSPETLANHLQDEGWRIVDCRHNLAEPDWGEAAYRKAHIPGALFAHLDRDLSAPKSGRNGRHPLPDPKDFARWLGERGIGPAHRVIAYDDAGGMAASRLWWMLRWLGHRNAALLDGGLASWLAAGLPMTDVLPRHVSVAYSPVPDAALRVDIAEVEGNLAQTRFTLLDARAAPRYAGTEEKLDARAGHIPGALNRNFQLNLDANGRFKSPETLRAEFGALLGTRPAQDIVHYCGSGVSACHNIYAMTLAGMSGSRLYAGSWSEWSSDPARPFATGDRP